MNEYVAMCSHQDELYALTKDGKLYHIFVDDVSGNSLVTLIKQLPVQEEGGNDNG